MNELTEKNARRFVQARRPSTRAERRTERFGRQRITRVAIVDGRGAALTSGKTAGEAWLRAALQIAEHDNRVAAEKAARAAAETALLVAITIAQQQAAALRYAAVRIEQCPDLYTGERKRYAELLRKMADET